MHVLGGARVCFNATRCSFRKYKSNVEELLARLMLQMGTSLECKSGDLVMDVWDQEDGEICGDDGLFMIDTEPKAASDISIPTYGKVITNFLVPTDIL